MSRSVDQRVVEMKFDNKQFENAVSQSRRSIKLMEKDLDLLEGIKSLKNLDKAVLGVDFSHMSKSLDKVKDSFSVFGTIGRSIINKLTTDAMNKFSQMTNSVSSSIRNVFNQVYTRGLNRANNLESSAFKIQGLLDRDSSIKDENKKLEITRKLSNMISESVTDTAFGLDQASVVASTLASTFGTDDKALEKIRKTLNAISGIAGTTGASYEQIADIFTDASGKGVAMGEEFARLSLQGVAAQEEIAKYVNSNLNYRKKLNKELGKSVKHEITGAEVLKLASKRKISAELFAESFSSFIDTAKEANETLGGVTSNIGAAMGRLGALFMQPLVENSGPLIKFLQAVKSGISAIAKVLDNLNIPKNITDILNTGLKSATSEMNDLVESFNNGETKLNEFILKIKKLSDALHTTLEFDNTDRYVGMAWNDIYRAEATNRFISLIKKRNEELGKSYRSIKDIKKDFSNTSMKSDQVMAAAQEVYLNQMTDGMLKTKDQWIELYTEYYKIQMGYYSMSKKEKKELLKSNDFKELVNESAIKKWEETLWESNRAIDKIAENQARLKADDEIIYGYDYLKDVLEGIRNIGSSILTIFKMFGESIFEATGPINDFFNIITGSPREARKSLNNLSKGFKESTEHLKDMVENNEGVRSVISLIGKSIRLYSKAATGIIKIIAHLAVAIAPLASKIVDIIGSIFNTVTDNASGNMSLTIWDVIVNTICKAIDIFVGVLENLWSLLETFFGWLYSIGAMDFIAAIGASIIEFAKTAYSNWPKAWSMIKNGLKGFSEEAKKVCSWIGKKIQPALISIMPHLNNFADKVYDMSNGFINLKKPLEWLSDIFGITTTGTNNMTDAISNANKALENMTSSVKNLTETNDSEKNGIGIFKAIDSSDAEDSIGATGNLKTALKNGVDVPEKEMEGPFAWIINLGKWLKEQFSKISAKDVEEAIGNGLKILAVVGTALSAVSIAKGIRSLGRGIENISAGIIGYDVKAERIRRLSDVLKSIAIIMGVFIGGIIAISIAVYALGNIPQNQLSQGVSAIIKIGGMIAILVIALAAISMFLQGRTKIGAGGSNVFKSFGLLNAMSRQTNGPADITTGAAKELKSIALIMGVFVAGIVLVARQAKTLGEMNPKQLEQGMNAILKIGSTIIDLILVLAVVMAVVVAKDKISVSGNSLKGFGAAFGGIASILFAFTFGIKTIANLIISLTKEMDGIDPGNLETSMVLIGGIMAALLIMVAVIMILSNTLLKSTSGLAPEKSKNIAVLLGMIAAIIFVIGLATGGIIRNLALLTSVSKIGDLEGVAGIFGLITVLMIGIVVAIMGFSAMIVSNSKDIGASRLKQIKNVMIAMAAIIFVIGLAIGGILRNIASMAIVLNLVKPDVIDKIVDILAIVMGSIFGIITVVLIATAAMSGMKRFDSKKMYSILGFVTVVSAIFAGILVALGYMIKSSSDASSSSMGSMTLMVGVAAGALAAIIFVASLMASMPKFDASKMNSLSIFLGALSVLFIAVGASIALIGTAKVSMEGILALGLSLVIVTLIISIAGTIATAQNIDSKNITSLSIFVGALAGLFIAIGLSVALMGDVTGTTVAAIGVAGLVIAALIGIAGLIASHSVAGSSSALKSLSFFVIALGALFALIGAGVYLVGKGVDIFANGISKLIRSLNMLGNEGATKNFKKGAKKLGEVISLFFEGIVDGIINFGDSIDKKKNALVGAIKKIGSVIREATGTVFSETLEFLTNKLGIIVKAIGDFLNNHKEDIRNVIIALEDILVPAIFNLLELLIEYLPELLAKLMAALIKYTPTFIKRLAGWILETIDQLVITLNNSLGTIVNAIHNLLMTLVNAMFMFFGMDPPFKDLKTQAEKTGKSISEIGDETIDEYGKSFENADVTPWVSKFIGAIGTAIWELVTNNPLIKNAAEWISDVMWKLTGLENRYNQIMANLKKAYGQDKGLLADIEATNKQWARSAGQTLEEWQNSGYSKKFWRSAAGKAKLAELMYKNGIDTLEEAKRTLGGNFNIIGETYFEEAIKYLKSSEFKNKMNDAAYQTSKFTVDALNKATDSHSPSRVMQNGPGKNIGDGVIVGVINSIKTGAQSIGKVATSSISSSLLSANSEVNKVTQDFANNAGSMSFKDILTESFSGVGEKMRRALDESGLFGDFFSITPRVDLTNVENSKSSIQSMFDSMGIGINVDSASDMFSSIKTGDFSNFDVSSIASGFDSANGTSSSSIGSADQNTNITFNQNNFSPESLSSIDIYRQTESLLGSNSTVNGIMNAIGVKSSDVKFNF